MSNQNNRGDTLYRELILEHWKNPQNYGVLEIADIDVSDVNPFCGDEIRVTARVKNNKIAQIAFTSTGCAVSKASASLFTEEIKGKTRKEIQTITSQNVLDLLTIELTPTRRKCALLIYAVVKRFLSSAEKVDELRSPK